MITKILRKYDFYKLLHPISLMVTFPAVFILISFFTKSLLKGLVISVCLLAELILFLLLKSLREIENEEESITSLKPLTFQRRWVWKIIIIKKKQSRRWDAFGFFNVCFSDIWVKIKMYTFVCFVRWCFVYKNI